MKESKFRKSWAAASLAALLVLPVAAAAGSNVDSERTFVKVSFSDLDISDRQGLITLYRRLQDASEEACGPITYREAGNDLRALSRNKQCYRESLSKSVDKVGSDALRELHNS